jgi:hypothetical protein
MNEIYDFLSVKHVFLLMKNHIFHSFYLFSRKRVRNVRTEIGSLWFLAVAGDI